MDKIATYWRVSTEDQSKERQVEDVHEWLDEHGLEMSDVDVYDEGSASGTKVSREQFRELIEGIDEHDYDAVLVTEISRISRKGALAQEFFDTCEDAGTDIHVLNGSVEVVKSDGTNRLIADVIAAVAAEEHRSMIRRTKAGIEASDKWSGRPPAGFTRDEEGYLALDTEAFLNISHAIERIEDDDASYRSEAEDLDISRQALSNLHKEHSDRYLELEDDNPVVQQVLDDSELATA